MASLYPVSPAWILLLRDLGIDPAAVLRRAGLPEDLFARAHGLTTADEFAHTSQIRRCCARLEKLRVRRGTQLPSRECQVSGASRKILHTRREVFASQQHRLLASQ